MTKHMLALRDDILIALNVYFRHKRYLNNGLITETAFDLLCKKIKRMALVIRS